MTIDIKTALAVALPAIAGISGYAVLQYQVSELRSDVAVLEEKLDDHRDPGAAPHPIIAERLSNVSEDVRAIRRALDPTWTP